MKKSDVIKAVKSLKKKINNLMPEEAPVVSYSRRIEKVKTHRRICAMTFDDGPTKQDNITSDILDILAEFGAKGTFDVIGTTENNYPDNMGTIGTPSWSGEKFDHYPKFGCDNQAGVLNCGELVKRILDEGHEITNHTYSHILFGKKNIIYSKRDTLKSYDEVVADIKKLHELLMSEYGYEMIFSRPPHYVDKIAGGFTSYDVYSLLSYNYLAASFDGAGWLPCVTPEKEIEEMTSPLEKALKENPDALAGQIIFQKDGYNMALRAPIKHGLRRQLEILYNYGYEVVTVSELMNESPFSDVGRDDDDFELFFELQKKRAIVYKDNTLLPDKIMTIGELAMLLAPREYAVDKRAQYIKMRAILPYSLSPKNPYCGAVLWAIDKELILPINGKAKCNKALDKNDIVRLSDYLDIATLEGKTLTRREIFKALK